MRRGEERNSWPNPGSEPYHELYRELHRFRGSTVRGLCAVRGKEPDLACLQRREERAVVQYALLNRSEEHVLGEEALITGKEIRIRSITWAGAINR